MISRIYIKACQIITPLILKTNYFRAIHIFAIMYAKKWHPYVDDLLDNQVKIFEYLKLEDIKYTKIRLTATGVLQLYTIDTLYMVPCGYLSNESLFKNYYNWLTLKESTYFDLVDYQLNKVDLKSHLYFTMTILQQLSNEKKAYDFVINRLKNKDSELFFSYIDMHEANEKLNQYIQLDFSDFIKSLKSSQIYSTIGPIHGDLTLQNMLQKNDGKIVIIDLDRFVFNGAQFIDEIHFYIESIANRENTDWLEILPRIIITKEVPLWEKEKLVGYFLYRINEEIRNYIMPSENYLKNISVCSKKILACL